MGDWGTKIGDNLNTNTDLQLKFTTKYSTLKLYRWINAEFTTDGGGAGSVEIPHDLGYVPIFEVWGKHTAQFSFLSGTSYPDAYSLLGNINSYRPYGRGIDYSADNEKITIQTLSGGLGTVSSSTTYQFRVLIWVDPSEDFEGDSPIVLNNNIGFKSSKPEINVFEGQEYEMQYSSKYKGVQYFPNHIQTASLTLPAMFASYNDQQVQEATYVDFNHNLGFPPRFLLFSDVGGSELYEAPYSEVRAAGSSYDGLLEISAWCDSSRVRVLFHRESKMINPEYGQAFSDSTISLFCFIATEDLTSEESS